MLWNIIRFEISYRMRRPLTYVFFLLLFFMSFGFITTDVIQIGSATGQVFKNAPFVINQVLMILMVFGTLIISAMMGVPVYRDFEHNFHEIIFTTPLKKWQYLGGRFLGSYLVALFIFSGILLGILIGQFMPWIDKTRIGPFIPNAYINPFLIYVVPNLLLLGIIFFSVGSVLRNQLVIYVQGIIFFALYLIVLQSSRDAESNKAFSLLDPFGLVPTSYLTKYWTPAEKNTLVVPLKEWLLYNRLFWSGIAIVIGAIGYRLFKFSKAGLQIGRRKKSTDEDVQPAMSYLKIPAVSMHENFSARLQQFLFLVKFDFKSIVRSVLFLAITFCGVVLLALNAPYVGRLYGTSTYPVTYMIMDLLTGNFNLFQILIIAIYTGELTWKEIKVKIAPVTDAAPLPNRLILFSKFTAMILVVLLLHVIIMLTGIGIQIYNGFYTFDIPVYLKSLFLYNFSYLFLVTLLAFLVHSLISNEFLADALIIIFYIVSGILPMLNIDNNLLYYGNAPSTSYSGMNGYGHFVFPLILFNTYWLALGIVFLFVALLMMRRGSDLSFASRLKSMRSSWQTGNGKAVIPLAILVFVVSGGFIYYNTHVLNTYRTPNEQRHLQATYEKNYRARFLSFPQPRITDVKTSVDIFAAQRQVDIKGTYIIQNKTKRPIDSLIISIPGDAIIHSMEFGISSKKVLNDSTSGFYIYQLNSPLEAGDSITLSFSLHYGEKGFPNNGGRTDLVYNGTFINNLLFPQFGYDESQEVTDDDARRKEGLPNKVNLMNPINDTAQYANTYLISDADWINYEATVSTDDNQIAISPGYLIKDWKENGRHYFQYKMDSKIWNFFSFLSADYQVFRDKYNDVNIEIYYQKGQEFNLKNMDEAIKKTLDYAGKNFSPYQHKQVRIIEFPRYQTFAQSFPNTIPFSEGIGFIMNVDNETDIDNAFYVTSHEVAHQWWGHQVCGANVQGSTIMVETMAQYTALMVMEHQYGKNNMQKFLKYELDNYLRGRSAERKREQPIMLNENQPYIHYNKGSLVMYALKDYIGEDSLNAALHRFVERYQFQGPPYPTSVDFVNYLRAATPDSLQYLIHDLFETITLFSNKTDDASYTKNANGSYDVTLNVEAQKLRADSVGNEKEIPLHDWIDIGVYTKNKSGKDTLIYLQKKFFDKKQQEFKITVDQLPSKAGIDPLNILIDRNSDDNSKEAEEKK